MAKQLSIKILAKLNESESISKINSQLEKMQKDINLGIDIDSKQLNSIKSKLENLQNQFNKQNKGVKVIDEDSIKNMSGIKESVKDVVNEYKKLGNVKVNKTLDPVTRDAKEFTIELEKANGIIERIKYEGLKVANKDGGFDYKYRLDSVKEINNEMRQREKILQKEQETRKAITKQEQQNRQEYKKWWDNTLKLQDKEGAQREKVLQYEQKIRNEIDKQNKKQQDKTDQLEHQIELFKKQAQINVQNLKRQFNNKISPEGRIELEKYLNAVQNLSKETPNAKRKMEKLNMEFKQTASNVRTAQSRVLSFGEQLKIALSRIPIWINLSVVQNKLP